MPRIGRHTMIDTTLKGKRTALSDAPMKAFDQIISHMIIWLIPSRIFKESKCYPGNKHIF